MKTNSKYTLEIGVDVSKATLDVCFQDGSAQSFKNSSQGIKALFKHIKKEPLPRISCESTGTYSELLLKESLLAGIAVSLINPARVKDYIRSFGKLAKTDRIDAKFIMQYAADRNPEVLDTSWLKLNEVKQIYRRMNHLIKQRAELKSSIDKYDNKKIVREIKTDIKNHDKRIKAYGDELDTFISNDEKLSATSAVLRKTSGVGPQTCRTLIIHMPELGSLSRETAATLAGLAPMHDDSGTMKCKRFIQGGRGDVRRILYMASVAALRCNEHLKAYYKGLKARGKASKVAIIAVARKLLVHLNSELKREFSAT